MQFKTTSIGILLLSFFLCSASTIAQETQLLRNPSIHGNNICFVYGGDLWSSQLDGSNVKRLTAFEGVEGQAHYSPDGKWIAFSAQYDGNLDVYVIPSTGGEPKRLTWHPGADLVRTWSNDSKNVLFASGRSNAPYALTDQLWLIPASGGNAERFILPRAFNGKFSSNGMQFVYELISPWESEFRNYRGGQNKPLRIFDLSNNEEISMPWQNSRDIDPVWVGNTIYFLSDRDLAMNIWAYDVTAKTVKQITFFSEFDCKNLEGDKENLIFEYGGYLYSMKVGTAESKKIPIQIQADFPWFRAHWTGIEDHLESLAISPNGKRVLIGARGNVITLPAKDGDARIISNNSAFADRQVAWSPDGNNISYFSDESGEYQLIISDPFGKAKRTIKIPNPTFYYRPIWSPDSKFISFYNENRTLWIVNVASGAITEVANEGFAHPEHVIYGTWSPDSKWLAYTKRLSNEYSTVFIYSLEQKKSFQISDGMADCTLPAWDKNGKYLYFTASIDYGMNVGWLDMSSFDHPVNRSIYVAILSKDEKSPLAPKSDEEVVEKKEDKTDKSKDKESTTVPLVKIDLEGLQNRILALPVEAGHYTDLQSASEGCILFTRYLKGGAFFDEDESTTGLYRFTFEKKEAELVAKNISYFRVAANGEKYVSLSKNKQVMISNVMEDPNPEEELISLASAKIKVDPSLEYQQIFKEAWRYQRDYFYVKNVHGLDMDWAYKTYAPMVKSIRHRSDLNYLLDILGGETAIAHSFVGGGDYPEVDRVPVGLLGADFIISNGAYQIHKIYNGENWNANVSAPLSAPGLNIKEGDYILAVNGVALNSNQNFYSYFDQCANKQTRITVNSSPTLTGAKEHVVIPLSNEGQVRQYEWVESNRRKVNELSGGKLAYVWLPNTGQGGYNNFNRYYFAQKDKKGVIVDERFNQGGSIADYIVDLLSRDLLGYFNNPIGNKQPFTAPNGAIFGPKVMIVNEMAGSGGDMLPYMFKQRNLGPIVGTTTWGGLVGIWDVPNLVDGGYITSPRGGFYNLDGEWDVENIGVAPDIFVEQIPKEVIQGKDPQLEKAVQVAMDLLKTQEVELLPQPVDPIRSVRPKK